ncbi:hypothetical protein A499_05335 [Niallia nealsonii AAU1]|nr:hypothetical protein A499_05335 [Niallia nealsonii AAU1]
METDPLTVPAYGYELIREILIPELLGRDTPDLLYWQVNVLLDYFL